MTGPLLIAGPRSGMPSAADGDTPYRVLRSSGGTGPAEYMFLLRQEVTAAASHLISQPSSPEGGLFKADSETRLKFRTDG